MTTVIYFSEYDQLSMQNQVKILHLLDLTQHIYNTLKIRASDLWVCTNYPM